MAAWFQLLIAGAIEVSLADFSPIFGGVRSGVSVFPKTLVQRVAKSFAQSAAPGGIDGANGGVYGMAEFMHADAFVVVTIQQEIEQILLAKAGDPKAAGATDALVQGKPDWASPDIPACRCKVGLCQ
jgi:hypothetical protein